MCIRDSAIAKDPKIYLFDDSFSALDFKTDVALRRALKAQTDNVTVIIVAQRISTVLHANQILVLDEGRLVGKGTHAQLMASCPEYQAVSYTHLDVYKRQAPTLTAIWWILMRQWPAAPCTARLRHTLVKRHAICSIRR